MSYIMQAVIVIALLCPFLQSRDEPQRYSYHVFGEVRDEHGKEMGQLTVCVVPAERPINGRIPCDKTSDSGTFSLITKDIPDKYQVCASTTESIFVLVGDKDPEHRVVCSGVLTFGPKDEEFRVNLQFKAR